MVKNNKTSYNSILRLLRCFKNNDVPIKVELVRGFLCYINCKNISADGYIIDKNAFSSFSNLFYKCSLDVNGCVFKLSYFDLHTLLRYSWEEKKFFDYIDSKIKMKRLLMFKRNEEQEYRYDS